jgi:hypothetical protein
MKYIEHANVLFMFDDLTTLSNYNSYSSSLYDVTYLIHLIRLLSKKSKYFLHSLVQSIQINIIVLKYFLKEIALIISFRFVLDFFNN